MKNKIKGFTLVELLAVIIILSVIALITVPIVWNQVKTAEKKAFSTSTTAVKKATESFLINNELEQLPDCESEVVNVKKLNLKNDLEAFYLDESYICYDIAQKCNYIYAISKNKNYQVSGCYDDVVIRENNKKNTKPEYNNFDVIYLEEKKSLQVDIDWYDSEYEISKVYYAIREKGASNWSSYQESDTFTEINLSKTYEIKSMAINTIGVRNVATTTFTYEQGIPTCKLEVVSGTMGKNGYYNTDVTVKMTTSTAINEEINYTGPVTSTTASYNSKVTSGVGTSTFMITNNGTTTLYGYVKSGDKTNKCSKTIMKDSNPKSVTITGKYESGSSGYTPIFSTYTSGTWINKEVILSANITEGTSKGEYKSTYTYQWYKDGIAISGATSSTYGASNSGSYTVKVTSKAGKEVTSSSYNVKYDGSSPSTPTVSVKDYGRSLTFTYSSSDSESGIKKYIVKYKKSSDSSWTNSSDLTTTSYSINTDTATSYSYVVCAYNNAGSSSCSSSDSQTTYTGVPSGNYTVGSTINYAGKTWYVISDSGSSKGSYLTLLQKDVVGNSGGNNYNNALTYLNSTSYKTGILSSDCSYGGIVKQNKNCITTDSGITSYASAAAHPYWIGSGEVASNWYYYNYSINSKKVAGGVAAVFLEASKPSKNGITQTYYTAVGSQILVPGSTMSISNSISSGTYQTVTTSNFYGSDYYQYFIIRPNDNTKYRLSITKYGVQFDCNGTPAECQKGGDSYQEFKGTGLLTVRVCGGSYHGKFLTWKAGSAKAANFTYGSGTTAYGTQNWSSSKSVVNAYVGGVSTSTTADNSTYGTQRYYDNVSDYNCVNHRTQTINTASLPYYYRPYIKIKESYTA